MSHSEGSPPTREKPICKYATQSMIQTQFFTFLAHINLKNIYNVHKKAYHSKLDNENLAETRISIV